MHRIVALLVCASMNVAIAQEQERALMDRVLKPDMTLQNSAQGKQFAMNGSPAPTKRVLPKMFQFLQRHQDKNYAGVRSFGTREFPARISREQHRVADISSRSIIRKSGEPYPTPAYSDGARNALDANKSLSVMNFRDRDRTFLVRGKSQKALSAQDRQLTIDEVRELLNKNK